MSRPTRSLSCEADRLAVATRWCKRRAWFIQHTQALEFNPAKGHHPVSQRDRASPSPCLVLRLLRCEDATPAHDAIKYGGLLCFDEADASVPEAGVAFNGMTDDQPFYTFPCGQVDKHESFVAICCMNTYGNGASADYVGRFRQDAASMSRFVKVYIDYDARVEQRIAGKHVDVLQRVWDLREACTSLGIRHIVSTRMIDQARKARVAKVTRKCLDRDVLFAGLDDGAIKQVKAQMKQIATNRKRGA